MRTYITLSIVLIALLLVAFKDGGKDAASKRTAAFRWMVQKTSTLRIQGATNVNTFGCDIQGYYQQDTIAVFDEQAASKPVNLSGALEIDIMRFDCHNKLMTNDLRKLLKAKEHPNLVIRFLSLDRSPVLRSSKEFIKGWVEIELAGTCRRFDICYTFNRTAGDCILLNGNRSFSFADFDLVPPTRLGGIIKVKDKFTVDFDLALTPVQ